MLSYDMVTQPGSRETNEDDALCVGADGNWCFAVADGLGGHGNGEIASAIFTKTLRDAFCAGEYGGGADLLECAFTRAQDAILEAQPEGERGSGMMTTAVALTVIGGMCRWGHIGDSRLYMFRGNKIKARTLDHSVPQMLVFSGEIKENQIRSHPDRNRILRALGARWDSPRYEISGQCPARGRRAFLLCSDGFWEHIEETRMCASLKRSRDAQSWLRAMTQEVEKNGEGKNMDNYTAVAVIL
ncbi:MAG: protein phosphatase 2C domain-containing protein [Oscillospiraceae bacterium]|jgi:serine/threonine protein phosphatase PrpC|nr:protein phosphatase 2C domain-containing protein [Oscillospiraceae bacterium]